MKVNRNYIIEKRLILLINIAIFFDNRLMRLLTRPTATCSPGFSFLFFSLSLFLCVCQGRTRITANYSGRQRTEKASGRYQKFRGRILFHFSSSLNAAYTWCRCVYDMAQLLFMFFVSFHYCSPSPHPPGFAPLWGQCVTVRKCD